jgi:hypothetical protein
MREYKIEIGGGEKVLRYTRDDRKALEERFDKGLRELINDDVWPTQEGVPTGGGRMTAQVAIVHVGIRHCGPAITESKVEKWLFEDLIKQGRNALEILATCVVAILESGVLGLRVEVPEAEPEGKDESEKEPSAQDSPPSTST